MISIVIPAWNLHESTMECITAVRETTKDCEIILVDNGSDPPYTKPYTGFIDCKLIRNSENKGFPAAVNQGVRASTGDVVVLLNNDVIVTPGWSEKLLEGLNDYSIVGPVANDCAGMQRARADVYENKEQLFSVAKNWAESYDGHIQDVRWVIGFCMAFKRSVYEDVGPFDESLWPCCGEEIDFCLRAEEKGHKAGIVWGVYVHHDISSTFRLMDKEHPYEKIIERNEAHLEGKWGKDWKRQDSSQAPAPTGLCLNLGCGNRKIKGYINIDNRQEVEPDIAWDILNGLPYQDGVVHAVRAYDFLEHIPSRSVFYVMNEIWRVLEPGGVFESFTPDAEYGQGAFQDPHHESFWVENTWRYFSCGAERDLYGTVANFSIESIRREETDERVFHLHVIAKAIK